MSQVYRVDKFVVPDEAREEFWSNVRHTHEVLRTQPGFVRDVLLEKHSGAGRFNAVTIVTWSGPDDLPRARAAVERMHGDSGFHPAEFYARTGIEPDVANYTEV